MVGVGGRSKACDECRRRRIKCDLTTPHCKRCLKAGLQCGGSRGLSIVQYDGRSGRAVSSNTSSIAQAISNIAMGQDVNSSGASHLDSMNPTAPWSIYRPQMPHEDIFVTYTVSQLLEDGADVSSMPGSSGGLAKQCLVALSTTYFGIAHMEKEILRRGMSKYGKSLRTLNQRLGDQSASRTLDVLQSIMIMALFEYLISDLEAGWLQHSRGLERLLEIRGPESMTSLPCLTILESVRPSIIFSALLGRQNTILASPDWKTLPWVNYAERKDAMQLLIDILADCPELFVLRESLPAKPAQLERRSALHQLEEKAYATLDSLHAWKQGPGISPWTEVPSPSSTPEILDSEGLSMPIWQTVYHFESLYQANIMSLYHGAIILVSRLCLGIQLELDGDKCAEIRASINMAGLSICRSINYHMERRGDDISSLFILFPLRMAFDAVGVDNVEIGSWLKAILQQIYSGSAGRWATARYLLDIQPLSNNPTPT
ncbi:Zn(2)-C6 fungal-type domain-containing protein [Trichoderma simmonsii]|uniref:Zn(2)-C6 fungal-type domain-containing protein n=1 Tax=Trichoderma simmonsii TaxID=1491479 RepID=A0A8G0LU70_9HYPO|nr:Zn(2)-C6 fungal-type domain-containing protein [Trichoderma simmonsii]